MADGPLGFVFPGAGVRPCGHETDFYRRHEAILRPFFDRGAESAGIDFSSAFLEGLRLGELDEQLGSYCFQCGVAQVFLDHGFEPRLLAGHSLGIYAALKVSGAVTFETGFEITRRAYVISRRVCAAERLGMAIVIGLAEAEVQDLLLGCEGTRLASSQNPSSHVVSGRRDALERLVAEARARDAYRARLLDIGFPYHHPELMAQVTTDLASALEEFEWRRARHPVVSSLDRSILTDAEELKRFTARNLSTPLDWQGVMEVLVRQGVETVIECGLGMSLTVSGRMLPDPPRFVNVKNVHRRLGL